MIDFENEIYTACATALRNEFPGIEVSGELNLNPARFPAQYLEVADNYSLTTSRDSGSNENHVVVMIEGNTFSNKQKGRKTEAKAIFAVVDNVLNNLGFTRQTMMPLSYNESTVYRIVGRWTAIIDKEGKIYRR